MSHHQSSAVFFAPQTASESDTSSWDMRRPASPSAAPAPAPMKDATTSGRPQHAIADGIADVAVHPGQLLSAALVEREKMRDMLITSIYRFAAETVDAYRVTPETAEAAVAFIQALRSNMHLPKIAPDGDGGLMAVWEGESPPVALVVDHWKMHLVTNAATARAEYFDDLPFDGVRLPKELLEFIPKF